VHICVDNNAFDLNESAIDTGTKYMASGYLLSNDGTELSFYSGGTPESHGGGGIPNTVPNGTGTVGSINPHSGVRLHKLRRDGFVGLEAGYGGAHNLSKWAQMLTVPVMVPNATACASGSVELRANIITGVAGGAYFQLERGGIPIPNFTLQDSVLLAGNCERHNPSRMTYRLHHCHPAFLSCTAANRVYYFCVPSRLWSDKLVFRD
jgi:hypothetical protein